MLGYSAHMDHTSFIHRCLELAERGRGATGINPLVGSVLVRDGKIIGEGWHSAFGEDHAERSLFKKFEQGIAQEDVLYVNLEPCCHTGKTPPCTEIIIESGVKMVVYGMEDPNSEMRGKGLEVLKSAGIKVIGPVERARCEWLNKGFISLHKQGRPWITLKRAQAMGGDIANPDGSPLKITSEQQDKWSHARLRATHDAILVGVQTVITDDPQLSTRFIQNKKVDQLNPLRIVLDPNSKIKENAKIVTGEFAKGTVVIVGEGNHDELKSRGVRVWGCPLIGDHFDWDALWSVLTTPKDGFFGVSTILVEGGPTTWKIFKESEVIDEEVVLVGTL